MGVENLEQALIAPGAARMGVVKFEVAAVGTLYNAASGWEDFSKLDPGTFKPDLGREKFDLKLGMPQTLIASYVTGQSGKIAFDALEYSARAIEIVAGGADMSRTTTAMGTVSAAPAPTVDTFTVTSVGVAVVGSWIVVPVGGVNYDRKIKSINAMEIILESPLPAAPATGAVVAKVTEWIQPIGGTKIDYLAGRATFTDTNGDEAILYFPKIASVGKFAPNIPGAEIVKIPVEFDVYGVRGTVAGQTDQFLMHHYLKPAL